ncbi:MAG: flagellar biosynthesis protein FlhF [bacterium]|nr:flagellar biosynthesis protein FlhF [bacterium]
MAMRIKKFLAPTLNEAMTQIRAELGDDAVILKTERIERKGKLSGKNQTVLEVTAATLDRTLPQVQSTVGQDARDVQSIVSRRPPLTTPREGSIPPAVRMAEAQSSAKPMNSSQDQMTVRSLRAELEGLKGTVKELSNQIRAAKLPDLPPDLAEIANAMESSGLDEPERNELLHECLREIPNIDRIDKLDLQRWWLDKLSAMVPASAVPVDQRGQVIFLIGPTGVGKTTTLAKLATHHRFWGKRRVALCSIDTFRVAAIEQLKVFADIANLPLEVAFTPEELAAQVERFKAARFDAIFVDTPGRSPVDGTALPDMVEFTQVVPPDESFLLLSGTTALADLLAQFDRYRELPITRIVATKLDETTQPGRWLSFAKRTARTLSYWTVGQNVPDDIMVADPRLLARGILSASLFTELQQARFKLHAQPNPSNSMSE